MTDAAQVTGAQRALMPDILRLFALFGIVVVNVELLAFPIQLGAMPSADGSLPDLVALGLVYGLALLKSYSLFSFMFGVGLAYLMRSAARDGAAFGRRYRNRMIGLAVLGLLHAVFFYFGDILLTYAILGCFLYLMRNFPTRRLVIWGGVLLALQSLIALLAMPVLAAPSEIDPQLTALEQAAFGEGSFLEAAGLRLFFVPVTLLIGNAFQGLSALGWFCLGLAAVRSGLIDDPAHRLWALGRRIGLFAIPLSLVCAGYWVISGDDYLGQLAVVQLAPFSTFGYLGLIAGLTGNPPVWVRRLLRVGGNSLTIYLGQSIALSFIFYGYGLGLWSQTSPAMAVLIALGVTMALIVVLNLWLARFRSGPFEALLRWFTRLPAAQAHKT